jgi:hypothetical protein
MHHTAGQKDMLANLCGLAAGAPEGTPPHAAAADWKGLGLMQLLKRASKRRSGAGSAPPAAPGVPAGAVPDIGPGPSSFSTTSGMLMYTCI